MGRQHQIMDKSGVGDSMRADKDRKDGKVLLQRHLWCPDDRQH